MKHYMHGYLIDLKYAYSIGFVKHNCASFHCWLFLTDLKWMRSKSASRLQNNLQQYNEVLFREIFKTSYITQQTNVFRGRGNNLNLLL